MRYWVLLGICLAWLTSDAEAATYYVAQSGGSNGNSCAAAQSESTPKATVNGVFACNIVAGDTVRIKAGTYVECIDDPSGLGAGTSWNNKIRFEAWPSTATVVLRPTSSCPNVVNFTFTQAYIEFDDIDFDGSNVSGPTIFIESFQSGRDAHHIRFSDADIKGNGSASFVGAVVLLTKEWSSGQGGNEFLGTCSGSSCTCKIWNSGTTEGLEHGFYVKSDGNIIDGCEITQFSAGGIHEYSSSGTHTGNTYKNNRIHDNYNLGANRRVWGVILSDGTSNADVFNNVIYRLNGSGNPSSCVEVYSGSTGSEIYQNTCYDVDSYGFRQQSFAGSITIRNNIAALTDASAFLLEASNTASNNLSSDPGMTNPGGGDFSLGAGASTAIDQGYSMTPLTTLVTKDIIGTARPQGALWDIGAYERLQGTAPTITITSPTSADSYITSFTALGSGTATLAGTASDNGTVSTCSWSNPQAGASGSCAAFTPGPSISWFVDLVPLTAGTNVVTATVCDNELNCTSDILTVTSSPQLYQLRFRVADLWLLLPVVGCVAVRRRGLWLVAVMLWATPAMAQDCELGCTVAMRRPFVVYTQAAPGATSAQIARNGVPEATPSIIVNGNVEFVYSGGLPTTGTHTFIVTQFRSSGPIESAPNVLTVVNVCVTDPLRFSVARWPAAASGRRRLDYETNRPATITLDVQSVPWRATAVDALGCRVDVTR